MICFVKVGDIGKRMREVRERQMSQLSFAEALDVKQPRLANWEAGLHDPAPEFVVKASKILGVPLDYFYGDDLSALEKAKTFVYYNSKRETDSKPDQELLSLANATSDPRTIRVSMFVGEGSKIWSAKGARREQLTTIAFITEGRRVIRLEGHSLSPRFAEGTVLVFQADEYPVPGVMLLLSSKSDPDQMTIRYIDPDGDPNALLPSEDGKKELLKDWNVIGVSWAEIRRAKSGSPHTDIRPDGVTWAKRLL